VVGAGTQSLPTTPRPRRLSPTAPHSQRSLVASAPASSRSRDSTRHYEHCTTTQQQPKKEEDMTARRLRQYSSIFSVRACVYAHTLNIVICCLCCRTIGKALIPRVWRGDDLQNLTVATDAPIDRLISADRLQVSNRYRPHQISRVLPGRIFSQRIQSGYPFSRASLAPDLVDATALATPATAVFASGRLVLAVLPRNRPATTCARWSCVATAGKQPKNNAFRYYHDSTTNKTARQTAHHTRNEPPAPIAPEPDQLDAAAFSTSPTP
jgi:hypothetical protein